MAVKKVLVTDIGEVTLQKRKGSKSLRISISSNGVIRVTMPSWAPFKMGLEFVSARRSWIEANRPKFVPLQALTPVGKAHHLVFASSNNIASPRTRLSGNEIIISIPVGLNSNNKKVQELANKAVIRALKQEAEQLLPARLDQLAVDNNFTYHSVIIKRLSSRWGSCDQHKNISLNCFLMQLPWNLIDYVLLHELTHTKIMAHGPAFWNELGKYVRNLPQIRKDMRTHRPAINY